jgi:glycyl-tRNA synthetase beta chain
MATFLLEVGTEELPAAFVASALQQWRSQVTQDLQQHLLTCESVAIYGTPRRLAIVLEGVIEKQPQQIEEIKGPPVQAAFKGDEPTPAALGFAKKQGVTVQDFEIRPTEKGEFIYVRKVVEGRQTEAVLADLIPQWIFGLEGKRFMRWGDGDLRFSRPIRWVVALWNDRILPVTIENAATVLQSDRHSAGHRVLHPEPVSIGHAKDYVKTLQSAFVQVDPDQRRQGITKQLQTVAKSVGGTAEIPEDLLTEVIFLVEWPTAVAGQFDKTFLELPSEVVTTEMVSHQRYFPVRNKSGALLPNFITISNGDPEKGAVIAAGNERVIRARLSDGQFFFKADQGIPLADYLPKLETVTFQQDLGSVRAKVDRIQQVTEQITTQLKLDPAAASTAKKAALLCKADLVTQMVGEFPELQGIMGEKYALTSGESPTIATAIAEHYQPRTADDQLPQSLTGQIVAIADRLDTLVSIFGIGLIPSGSSDPFALRRSANAVVNIIWQANLGLNLTQLLQDTVQRFSETFKKTDLQETLLNQLQDFFLQRIRTLLQEEHGIDYDLVNAVLGEADPEYTQRALTDVLDARARAQFLQKLRVDGTLGQIYETVNRATRLAKQGELDRVSLDPAALVQPKVFEQSSEQAFYDALVALLPQTQKAAAQRDYGLLVNGLQNIAPTVSNFFDGDDSVLVMADDPALRRNRLNLLGLLRNHARVLADFGEIVKAAS